MEFKYKFDEIFQKQLNEVKDEYNRSGLDKIQLSNIEETIRTAFEYVIVSKTNLSLNLADNFLETYSQISDNNFLAPENRIRSRLHFAFVSWIQTGNTDLYCSIIIELLGFIINNTTLSKNDSIEIEKSERGYYLLGKNGGHLIQICTLERMTKVVPTVKNDTYYLIRLSSYFNIIYQLAIKESAFLSNLLSGKYKKNFKFKTLIDNILQLDELILDEDLPAINIKKDENSVIECLKNSAPKPNNTNSKEMLKKWQRFSLEPYMIEQKTGVFTAWKIYSMTYEIWKSNKKDTDICSKVKDLTKQITSIHNLDLRLYVLDYCKQIFQTESNTGIELADLLSIMIPEIKTWAKIFNDIYGNIFILLLYRYREDTAWKTIFYIESESEVEQFKTYSFSKIYSEIKALYAGLNSTNSYHSKELFYDLYSTDAKSDQHKWFTTILNNVENFFNE